MCAGDTVPLLPAVITGGIGTHSPQQRTSPNCSEFIKQKHKEAELNLISRQSVSDDSDKQPGPKSKPWWQDEQHSGGASGGKEGEVCCDDCTCTPVTMINGPYFLLK